MLREIVNAADVGMRDAARQLDFFLQERKQVLVRSGALTNGLERHALAQRQVFSFVYIPHAAMRDEAYDSEAACQQRGVGKAGAGIATASFHKCDRGAREKSGFPFALCQDRKSTRLNS